MKHIRRVNEKFEDYGLKSNEDRAIVTLETDDWVGVYYHGKLISQGHEIKWQEIVNIIFKDNNLNMYYDTDDFEELFDSHCPKTLDEVKMKLDTEKYNL